MLNARAGRDHTDHLVERHLFTIHPPNGPKPDKKLVVEQGYNSVPRPPTQGIPQSSPAAQPGLQRDLECSHRTALASARRARYGCEPCSHSAQHVWRTHTAGPPGSSCMCSPGGSWEWATLTGQLHVTLSRCVQSACPCHPGEVMIYSPGSHDDLVPVLLTRKSRPSDIAWLPQVTQLVSQSHICTPVCGTTVRAVTHDANWPQEGVAATMCLWLICAKDNFRTFYTVTYLTLGASSMSFLWLPGSKLLEMLWLKATGLYSRTVEEARSLKFRCGRGLLPLKTPGCQSASSCSCSCSPIPPAISGLWRHHSISASVSTLVPTCPRGISVSLSSSNKDVSHWIESPP